MFCSSCGTQLPAGTRFCGQCGAALEPVPAAPPAPVFNPPPSSPQPSFAAAAAAPAYAPQPAFQPQAAAPSASGGPMPPNMHWAILLVLTYVTFGLVAWIWAVKEAGFVKKLDPSSKAVTLMAIGVICTLALVVVLILSLASGSAEVALGGTGVMTLLTLTIWVVWLMAVFGMRSSMVRYYNTVEPIGLRLSCPMTFFFNILYFQYHFSRIAAWKKSGQWR